MVAVGVAAGAGDATRGADGLGTGPAVADAGVVVAAAAVTGAGVTGEDVAAEGDEAAAGGDVVPAGVTEPAAGAAGPVVGDGVDAGTAGPPGVGTGLALLVSCAPAREAPTARSMTAIVASATVRGIVRRDMMLWADDIGVPIGVGGPAVPICLLRCGREGPGSSATKRLSVRWLDCAVRS